MDPRHPEQAVIRLRDLLLQYNRIESDMLSATTTAQLGQLEREGGLVVQEICLVAPRIHESLMQTSRQRRHDLSKGIIGERRSEALAEIAKQTERISEQVSEIADTVTEKVKKTAKKKPAKKKTTKKAKK